MRPRGRSAAFGWPAVVRPAYAGAPEIVLRPLRPSEAKEWYAVRAANAAHLGPWEPTSPQGTRPDNSFRSYVRWLERSAAEGAMLPFTIEYAGELVGQAHLFDISRGSQLSGATGYWLAQKACGRGIATWAVAMLVDHAFEQADLHRVEVNIRTENAASLRVVRRLGLREEGVRSNFIHIDGAWRTHRSFAVTVEDLGGRLLQDRLAGGLT